MMRKYRDKRKAKKKVLKRRFAKKKEKVIKLKKKFCQESVDAILRISKI